MLRFIEKVLVRYDQLNVLQKHYKDTKTADLNNNNCKYNSETNQS